MLTSTSPSMISCLLPSLKQTYPLLIISVRLYSITVGFFKNLLGRKLVRNVLKIQAHLGPMFQRKAEIVRDFLGHLVQTLLKQGHLEPQNKLPRATPRWLLKISKQGESTTSLGNLFSCSVTSTVKYFLMFRWNFLCSSLCPFSLVLALGATEKCLSPSLLDLLLGIYRH